jgi:hypothetical protein
MPGRHDGILAAFIACGGERHPDDLPQMMFPTG